MKIATSNGKKACRYSRNDNDEYCYYKRSEAISEFASTRIATPKMQGGIFRGRRNAV